MAIEIAKKAKKNTGIGKTAKSLQTAAVTTANKIGHELKEIGEKLKQTPNSFLRDKCLSKFLNAGLVVRFQWF